MSTPLTPSTSAWWVFEMIAKRSAVEALDEVELPQRLGPVQRQREQPPREVAQLLVGAGRRAARCGARGSAR
jgi:hypothetical protein